jgi:hypothetical protein
MRKRLKEVPVKDLRLHIDPKSLKVRSTGQLCPATQGIVGQDRAIEALKFGIGMHDPEYNIYIAGPPGRGGEQRASPARLVLCIRLQGA